MSPFVLMLGDGDRLTGSLVGIEGETLVWKNPGVGEMKVALKDVRELAKGSVTVAGGGQPVTEDTLTLSNGDVVKGIVSGFKEGKILVAQGGDNVPVPMESVGTVVFAATGKAGGAVERGFRVKLTDGSSLSGKGVSVEGETATLMLVDGSSRKLAVGSVVSIEQVNGPVTFLSSLVPTEDVQRPYLGDPWPTRFDQSVTGKALRTPSRVFARGIGVHAYSRLTYAIDASYKEFRTQYAIDGAGAYANVDVRILLDGKVAYEKKGVTSGEAGEVVKLPVGGVKTLTLEVDYGLSNDTQDRFMWLEAALVR
jgi:hypothetical protein